jgi:hypothetical protein
VHGAGINVHVLQLDFGIIAGHAADDLAPELGGFQHIGLVHRGELAAAAASLAEADVSDALNLFHRIAHGVEGAVAIFAETAVFTEIEAAQQFADHQNVSALGDGGLQGRAIGYGLIGNRGAEIGVTAQGHAQLQQARLRAQVAGQVIEVGAADGAQEHGVALQAGVQSGGREGAAASTVGGSAKWFFLELETVAGEAGHSLQYTHRFGRDFRADAVTGENRDFEFHGPVCLIPAFLPWYE